MSPIDLSVYRMRDGKLRRFSDVGCYPLFYVREGHECLCASCADASDEGAITGADANWEDPDLHCEGCGEQIESAYAGPWNDLDPDEYTDKEER